MLLAAAASACVHAQIERTGRMRLDGGREGTAPIVTSIPADFEEVVVVTITAEALATPERLEKHLARKSSLLGCDALLAPTRVSEREARASCLRRREPAPAAVAYDVAAPSSALIDRAARAGVDGAVLLDVLAQSHSRTGAARAWPLRWYLETYPNSPFRGDVQALFVPASRTVAVLGAPASVRTAPTLR